MSGSGLVQLRQLFIESYDSLKTRLVRRLGTSGDLAGDALHEAYVRLVEKGGLEGVQHPQSYLVNTAMHVAIDRMRREARTLSESEIENFLEMEDSAPGPAQSAVLREELEGMFEILAAMSPRQRDILVAIRAHGLSRNDLAKRWGISERQVGRELMAAHEFCAKALKEREAD
ncbi:sigma-24 [Pusillimonas sp. T7-7]|uniref:RNA polymerase sigma factor n=1 Tax=Pusillimonas sp. (strain T7-7) TaxID=1007105 RepID=UPI0002084AFB|nr:sigma-70 family RNA polymerase sigma factor [Pusillimonas sp. T7-7]AEC18823.1 sigma-24 [Pusillimonas sp. T7-7]